MTATPLFTSDSEYCTLRGDVNFWQSILTEILKRHDLADPKLELEAGVGSTYPTFLQGEIVVKLFGHVPSWRQCHAAERGAHTLLATNPNITAPSVLAEGQLNDSADVPWPYLITTRIPGVAWQDAGLSKEQRLSIAAQLGNQIRQVHALPRSGVPSHLDWPNLSIGSAAAASSLPPHLVGQIDDYLALLGPFDCVFVHGDLFSRHVFVHDGRLTGIIDWGDAIVTDRHYELAKLHLDTFDCDKELLQAFLASSDWPIGNDFPRQALGLALHRQAMGNIQHLGNDTFFKLPDLLPLQDIATLDELANELFAI